MGPNKPTQPTALLEYPVNYDGVPIPHERGSRDPYYQDPLPPYNEGLGVGPSPEDIANGVLPQPDPTAYSRLPANPDPQPFVPPDPQAQVVPVQALAPVQQPAAPVPQPAPAPQAPAAPLQLPAPAQDLQARTPQQNKPSFLDFAGQEQPAPGTEFEPGPIPEPTAHWMEQAHKAITSMPGFENFPPPPQDQGLALQGHYDRQISAIDNKIAAQRDINAANETKAAEGIALQRESANILNEAGIEANQIADAFDKEIEPELAAMRDMMRKIERTEIRDYWADKSGFRKVMSAIAMGLGAYASSVNGGPNHAANIIKHQIDSDYRRQKANLDKTIDAYKMRGANLQRVGAVYTRKMNLLNAATSARYKGIMAKVSEKMAAATTDEARAKGQMLLADLELAKAKVDEQMLKPFVEITKHQQKEWAKAVFSIWANKAKASTSRLGILTPKQWMDINKANGLTPDGSMSAFDSKWHRELWQNLQNKIPSRVKMTEGDKKMIGYYVRMRESLAQIKRLNYKGANPKSLKSYLMDQGQLRLASNDLEKAYFLAVRNYVTAVLRRDSGAAITEAEADKYGRLYSTEPGDGPETDRAKKRLLQKDFESTKTSAGKAYDQWAFNAGIGTTGIDFQSKTYAPVPWVMPEGAWFKAKRQGASDNLPEWVLMSADGQPLMGLSDDQKVGLEYRTNIKTIGDRSYGKAGGYNQYLQNLQGAGGRR